MGRLIDADKLQDYFWDNRSKLFQSKDCRIAIDNAPTVEAIPKDQYEARLKENNRLVNDLEELRTMINKFAESYENRLKADLKAILVELQLEIEEYKSDRLVDMERDEMARIFSELIQQKIDALKAESEDQDGQTSN